jgi:hypothetical protein
MPGTGSGFSCCGVCTGAGVCSSGVFDKETGVAALCSMLGASACVTGCADFFVSLLSHPTSNINAAARKTILERFKQHSMSAQAYPHHTFLLDGFGRRTAAFTATKGLKSLSHEWLKKAFKTAETEGYFGRSTRQGASELPHKRR